MTTYDAWLATQTPLDRTDKKTVEVLAAAGKAMAKLLNQLSAFDSTHDISKEDRAAIKEAALRLNSINLSFSISMEN